MNVIFENLFDSFYRGRNKENEDGMLEKRIKALPEEVTQFIYWEYLDTEVHFRIFMDLLQRRTTRELWIKDIRPYIPIALAKPKLVKHLREHLYDDKGSIDKAFDIVYNEYKINNKKSWRHLSNGDAFALSLVFHMYH